MSKLGQPCLERFRGGATSDQTENAQDGAKPALGRVWNVSIQGEWNCAVFLEGGRCGKLVPVCQHRKILAGWMKFSLDLKGAFRAVPDDGDRHDVPGGNEERCIEHVFRLVHFYSPDLKQNVAWS